MSVADRDDPSTRVGQPELDAAIAAVDVSGPIATAIGVHAAAADPHPGYDTDAEVATAIGVHAGASNPHPSYLKDHGAVTYLDATDAAAPGNPSSGAHRIYSKSDGIYYRDSAGVEKGPLGAGGTSGGSFPPLYDHAAKRRLYVYGSGAYNNAGLTTDGSNATAANATTAAMPQDAQLDLGDNPPPIGSVHIVYNDSGHRSDTGSLDWSDDAASWTSQVTWASNATTDRWHIFTPVTHRYWRIHTTVAGAGGSGIDIKTIQMFGAGRDRAAGLTPTSSISYNSIGNATDGDRGTKAVATAGGNGSTFEVDLLDAYAIIGAFMQWGDEGHSCYTGKLQYSTDNSTWVDVQGWSNTVGLEKYVDISAAPITARYWRINTAVVPSNAGLDIFAFELASAA